MATKTLTIREDVYKLLVSLKRADESFSDLLERLARETGPLALLNAMKGSIEFTDSNEVIEDIRSRREDWR